MVSPYAFYQFWLNVEDVKVGELLRAFTFLPREEIEALEAQTEEKPFLRAGQKALAEHVTSLVHGADETERIKAASAALFGAGTSRTSTPRRLRPPSPRRVRRRSSAATGSRTSWTCSCPRACPRARARRGAR